MQTKKLIIDCDPGIDDSIALMLALSCPELEVVGITTVCGNVPAELGAENALKILKFMDRLDIPVYYGAEHPLKRDYVSAQDTHGEDGLGEAGLDGVTEARARNGAVDFILETLNREENLSILAIGPLTNVALALQKEPEAFQRLDSFVSMGGSYKSHGNCSPVAEYNYWCDPHAAAYVYEHLGKKIRMVGLDVTRQIVLTPNLLEYMKNLDRNMGLFLESITRFYFDFHWKQEGVIGCVINDPLAVACLCRPEICKGFDAYTEVAVDGLCMGQTVVDAMDFWKKEPNTHVDTWTDPLEFMTFLITRLFGAGEEDVRKVLEQIMATGGERK